MRTKLLITSITLVAVSLIDTNSIVSARRRVALANRAVIQAPTRFSSSYTTLAKCGSGMTKKQEKEAEEQGSDIPTRCKGPGGYDVYISYSACASMFSLEKGEESIPLGMQAVSWKQKTVEWRLANGKPFALIMRVYEYAGNDQCATDGKIVSESLIVRGLKGYEQINETFNAKAPNSNVKARELADKGYAKAGS